MKDLEEEIFDKDETLKIVIDIEIINKGDRFKNDSNKVLKKDFPDKTEKLKEALLNYMGENYLKILKTEIPDKWKIFTKKLAYADEYFSSLDDYQKPVDKIKKEDFFSKFKNRCPDDEEIERTNKLLNCLIIKMVKN